MEVHDHANGICDLPGSPLIENWAGCHWDDRRDPRNARAWCGCWFCRWMKYYDRLDLRQQRQQERVRLHNYRRESAWGDDDY